MAKKAKTIATTLEQFTMSGNLDVNDVLSVVTSKAEEKYAGELQRCRDEAEELRNDNKKLRERIQKQATREALLSCKETEKQLRAAVEPLGASVVVRTRKEFMAKEVLPVNEEGKLTAVITLQSKGMCHTRLDFQVHTKPSKELSNLADEHRQTEEAIEELEGEALRWKRQLNNVPMLERRYRAKIASAKLDTSEDGKELLKLLTDDLDEAIEALPSC